MSEISDEQKKAIMAEIIELTVIVERPPNSIKVSEYRDAVNAKGGEPISTDSARRRLEAAVTAGKLKREMHKGVIYYWAATDDSIDKS